MSPFAGSQTTPSTSTPQQKSDEAVSRESPVDDVTEGVKADHAENGKADHAEAASVKVDRARAGPTLPVRARKTVQAKIHEKQPVVDNNKQHSQKKKKG